MLDSYRKGFAVMSEDLQGISFEDESLESCKRYCRKGYVIAERIPYTSGFQIRLYWAKWWKPIKMLGYYPRNLLWLHWSVSKIKFHKTGKIVHRWDSQNAL
jgi:hypothetical protein